MYPAACILLLCVQKYVICALGSLLVRMALPAAQVGMGGPFVINLMGPNTVEQIFLAAAQGNVAQVVYNGQFIQLPWPLLERLHNGVLPTGLICAAESGIQVLRTVDLWVRSDLQIHPYVEIGAALALFPEFDIAACHTAWRF